MNSTAPESNPTNKIWRQKRSRGEFWKSPNLNKANDSVSGKSCQIQADVAPLHPLLRFTGSRKTLCENLSFGKNLIPIQIFLYLSLFKVKSFAQIYCQSSLCYKWVLSQSYCHPIFLKVLEPAAHLWSCPHVAVTVTPLYHFTSQVFLFCQTMKPFFMTENWILLVANGNW